MSPVIGTTFEFERLAITLGTTPFDIYGAATLVADRRSWRIVALSADIDGVRCPEIKAGTPLFEKIRLALHRQCGADIAERLNGFVEERGGYEILFGEAMPADRFERGRGDRPAANDDAIYWIDAA